MDAPVAEWAAEEGIADQEIRERLQDKADAAAARKVAELGPETMREIEKAVLLQTLDYLWREHLVTLEHLRQAVSLRGYAQRDPLNEYKSEAFQLFAHMLARLRRDVTGQLMHVTLAPRQRRKSSPDFGELPEMQAHHLDPSTGEDEFAARSAESPRAAVAGRSAGPPPSRDGAAAPQSRKAAANAGEGPAAAARSIRTIPQAGAKLRATRLCPCGSGKKFKHCHGAIAPPPRSSEGPAPPAAMAREARPWTQT